MFKKEWALTLIVGVWFLTGCTRDIGTEAGLKLQVPKEIVASNKVSTLNTAGYMLGHVVVNIHNQDTNAPFLWHWDAHCEDNGCMPAPAEFFIQGVPEGSSLIQYLGVYKNSNGDGMILTYGDSAKKLVAGDNFVDILATQFGQSGGSEATILGQYVTGTAADGAGVGPTGLVTINFTHPTRPTLPMTIEKSEMFNGWFDLFAIQGVPFQYRLVRDGSILNIPNYDTLVNHVTNNNPPEISILDMPDVFWLEENNGGGNPNMREIHGEDLIYGFFGPAVGSISHNSQPAAACHLGTDSGAISGLYDTETKNTGLMYYHSTNTAGNFNYGGGGTYSANAPCNSGADFYNKIYIDPTMDLKDGGWGAAGFEGPFKKFTAVIDDFPNTSSSCTAPTDEASAFYCYDPTSAKIDVKWEYINEHIFGQQDSIDGVTMFVTSRPDCMDNCEDQRREFKNDVSDGYRCTDFQHGYAGMINLGDFTSASATSGTFNNVNLPNNEHPIGFLCPFKVIGGKKAYSSAAAEVRSLGGNSGGGQDVDIYKVTNSEDSTINENDMFLISSTSFNDIQVHWNHYTGSFSHYKAWVKDSSNNPVCTASGNLASSISDHHFSGCTLNDEEEYYVYIEAQNASNISVSSHNISFTRVFKPTLTAFSATCADNTGTVSIDFYIYAQNADMVKIEVDGEDNGMIAYTPGMSYMVHSSISSGGSYNPTVTVSMQHPSGFIYVDTLQPTIPINSGTCTYQPIP